MFPRVFKTDFINEKKKRTKYIKTNIWHCLV